MLIVSSRTSGAMYLWDTKTIPRCSDVQSERIFQERAQRCEWEEDSVRSGHRPLGAHPLIGGDVNSVIGRVVTDGQSQVSDSTGAVLLHEDVLGLQISVGDAWLSYQDTNVQHNIVASVSNSIFKNILWSIIDFKKIKTRNYNTINNILIWASAWLIKMEKKREVLNCTFLFHYRQLIWLRSELLRKIIT